METKLAKSTRKAARILVTEKIADGGIDALRAAGHEVDEQLGLSADELLTAVKGAVALIVRSATQVTAEVLAAGTELVIVGRAGLGVDNVDVEAATARGVMVANAPGTNSLSTAEHAMALLLSQARNIPQAAAALKAGRWEKSKWEGTELHGKTLGVLGLGRIGTLVAQRAHAFGMRLVAWDPWVSAERARQLGIELLELDDVFAQSDFVTIHLLKTKDSVNLIDDELLAKAKPGLRIVNAARGGIIDEDALARAIADGRIGGAALDVFAQEPTTDSPLFALDSVVATPHLGASTAEAQDKAGVVVAEQIVLALAGEFVPFAVNVAASEASETVQPFLPLAERLGAIYAGLFDQLPSSVEVEYNGQLADYDTRILTLSVLKGLFTGMTDEPVSYVNAPQIAAQRGVDVRETKTTASQDYLNLVVVRGHDHAVGGTLFGSRNEPRVVMLDDHSVEVPPADHMLVVRNSDTPGMVGKVGTVLGSAGVSISDLHLGKRHGEAAMQVLALDQRPPDAVLDELRAVEGIISVHAIEL
ncbi:MAG: D-3-phosphoglycerate dehydrogenase / 2-oxoglutarate reductase [Actinomycetota bacterium]|nr:D-3-phosphoglycerate dehydrogenase / 2-oxoglutarate reductase [Actinomycetota bacterium]